MAKPGLTSATPSEPWAWNATLAVEQAYNDNVEQQSGPHAPDDFITSFTGVLDWENQRKRSRLPKELIVPVQGHIYHNIPDADYFEIAPEVGSPLWWQTDLWLGYRFSPRRRLFDEGNGGGPVLYMENAGTAAVRRRFGQRKQLRAELGFDGEWDDYRQGHHGRDSFTPSLVWDLRYRFWSPGDPNLSVTPRFKLEYGRRHAHADNYDRDELTLSPGFDLQFPLGIGVRFRYERSLRDYTVGSLRADDGARNSNYQREDDISQYQTWLVVPLSLVTGLAVGARYRFRSGVYDEPNRKQTDATGNTTVGVEEQFDVHEVGLEVSYTF